MNPDSVEGAPDAPTTTLNRAQRRSFRRAILAEHRKQTRWWRRTWRGKISQHEVVAILKAKQKRAARLDAIYGTEAA